MSAFSAISSIEAVTPRRTRRSSRATVASHPPTMTDEDVLQRAEQILFERCSSERTMLSSSPLTAAYFRVRIGLLECEQFEALWLDSRHRILVSETLARGTIDQVSVYPREVIKAALQARAAAVVFAHNCPCGLVDPMLADNTLIQRLKDALALIDIRTLDHFIISGTDAVSFAERGWL